MYQFICVPCIVFRGGSITSGSIGWHGSAGTSLGALIICKENHRKT